jgi:drug/metabolite transporter (DMT)-like permease
MTNQQTPVVYVQVVTAPPTNALAVASLVLGIVAALLATIPLAGLALFPLPALLALIFGIIGVVTGNKLGGKRVRMAIAGIILSLSPLAIAIVSFALYSNR